MSDFAAGVQFYGINGWNTFAGRIEDTVGRVPASASGLRIEKGM